MEGFYVYFDRENRSVSFGNTTCSPRVANALHSYVAGYTASHQDVASCLYVPPTHKSTLPAYAVALIAVGSLLAIFILVGVTLKILHRHRTKSRSAQSQTNLDTRMLVDESPNVGP